MPIMDDKTKQRLVDELGITPDWADQKVQAEVAAGPLAAILQSAAEPFFELFRVVIAAGWTLFYQSMLALVPQLFIRYASGHWLDERALDDGLSRDPGQKTKLLLDCTKANGTPLTIDPGTVFFISEANPRRYQATAAVSPLDTDTAFQVEVEAICPTAFDAALGVELVYSEAYNAPTGLVWECESALPFTGIAYAGPGYVLTGEDPESDEVLRDRVFSKRSLGSVNPGGVLYYITLLKTVAGVAHVTHDATDPATLTMTYTLYGATGALDAQTQAAAQTLGDAQKMETDQLTIALAGPEVLPLLLSVSGGPPEADLIQSVSDHFAALARGQDFEEGPLYGYIFSQFLLAYPAMILRIDTNFATLPVGKYWVPQTTVQALV